MLSTRYQGIVASVFLACVASCEAAIIHVDIQGTLGEFRTSGFNLPLETLPYPDLIDGGTFSGSFSYATGLSPINRRFRYRHVDIEVRDRLGGFVHRIDSGPNGMGFREDFAAINFGYSFGPDSLEVPEDIRLTFRGNSTEQPFGVVDWQATEFLTGFVELDGPEPFTYWGIDVREVELTAREIPEPDFTAGAVLLWGCAAYRRRESAE